jgi:MoxR-like ATPase
MAEPQRLRYRRLFDAAKPRKRFDAARAYRLGDDVAPGRYVYDEGDEHPGRIELAVNVALATGRPLLVRGLPGTGKSSLAADVAEKLRWRYYESVVSSRTQARDLQWTFDAVKRLSDAQIAGAGGDAATGLPDDAAYIKPGVLWWAFDREQARRRGLTQAELAEAGLATLTDPAEPRGSRRAVVLIDEIDKADPDVPNDLLVPLGSFRFELDDTTVVQAREPPLVIITTNEERDLPRAFLRRCVTLLLEPPKDPRLRRIARAHFPDDPDDATLAEILTQYRTVQARQHSHGTPQASIAEFLDAVAACRNLGADPGDAALWKHVTELTLDKADDPRGGPAPGV